MSFQIKHLILPLVLLLALPCATKSQDKLLNERMLPLRVELEAAQVAIDTCGAKHVAVHVYVVDAFGNIMLLLVGDGAHYDTVSGARRKAYTAAILGEPTIEIQKRLAANPSLKPPADPMFLFLGGGVPIRAGGEVIGALAVGGGSPDQDAECAQAGLDKIRPYLQ
jgi:uncharacterized protein GlcG (DUF336 family)